MSAYYAVVAQSTILHATFDDVHIGRSSQFILGRLLSFWIHETSKRMEKVWTYSLTHECVVPSILTRHTNILFSKILRVAPATVANQYHHSLPTSAIANTTIDEVLTTALVINLQKFDHLLALANTNLELPDVVSLIRSMQGSDLSNYTSCDPFFIDVRPQDTF
ncbi:hypothetical protein Rs2_44677 [Raphanus sativus]|nr:hypothetical protein Rs2_44677 [Raphanus sativus]